MYIIFAFRTNKCPVFSNKTTNTSILVCKWDSIEVCSLRKEWIDEIKVVRVQERQKPYYFVHVLLKITSPEANLKKIISLKALDHVHSIDYYPITGFIHSEVYMFRFIGTTPDSTNLIGLLSSVTSQTRKAYCMDMPVSKVS